MGPARRQGREPERAGAWLHVLTDALGSVGAIAAAALIWAFGWDWADPAASALIGLLVIYSSWQLLAESVSVLMEFAPASIDVDEVFAAMKEVAGVLSVHDLHVWSITSGMAALAAHVTVKDGEPHDRVLSQTRGLLHDRFGIGHVTIQTEREGFQERAGAVCPAPAGRKADT